MAGYLFQCRLALLRGLQMAKRKPNGHIYIERFDDVAFEDEDFSQCLLQAKHSINPKCLDDMGVDVWKTLDIWINHFSQGIIAFSSTKFVLITTSKAAEGSAMALLRAGATSANRAQSLSLLLEAARASKNQRTADARAAFLALTHDQSLTLLNQIEVLDNHPNLIDVTADIEGEIVLIAPSHTAEAASYLEGWWLGVVGKCLVADASASIPVQHIIMKANEIGRSFGEDTLPVDDPRILGARGYSDDDEAEMFVRQMRAVDILDRVVRRSAQDYYRAFAQRSKWAREHLLLDSELSRYDANLKDRWHRKFDAELTTTAPSTELEKKVVGRSLCVWASQQSIPLRNIVEVWICSGSFQGLADRLQIGWHPDFETIFEGDFANHAP